MIRTLVLVTAVLAVGSPSRAQDTPAAPIEAAPAPASTGAVVEVKRPLRIAVYDLSAENVEPRTAKVFVSSLLAELRKLQRVSVLSLEEVRALIDLESQKQLMGCTESSCLAEIAEALGADALVVGGMANVNGVTNLALKRIDARSAEVVNDYTQQLTAAGGEELLAAVGPAVEKLFADVPLRTGEVRGVAPEVALRLNPPPVHRFVFAGAAATTALSAVVMGATALWWWSADGELRALFETAKSDVTPAQAIQDQQAEVQTANAAFWIAAGVTGVLAIGTGVMAAFTDFRDVGGAE